MNSYRYKQYFCFRTVSVVDIFMHRNESCKFAHLQISIQTLPLLNFDLLLSYVFSLAF